MKPYIHGAIAASLALVLAGCGLTVSVAPTTPAAPAQPTSAIVVAPTTQPTSVAVVVPTAAPTPQAQPAPALSAVPAPTAQPAPVAQKPTIGSLHIMDQYGTEQTERVQAGTELQLYVDQIHNAQRVTFYIQRGESLPAEVLGEADVIMPSESSEGRASLPWKVDATGPMVWLSARVDNGAGLSTSTGAYPLAIDSVPTPQPAPQPEALQYLWPSDPPQQMRIEPLESVAGEDIFVINLSAQGTQWSAQVTGGHTSRAVQLPTAATQTVTVRGQQGVAFSTGGGYSLFWQEGGQPYAIFSTLSLDDALALADDLQSIDRATWLANLEQVIEAGAPPR